MFLNIVSSLAMIILLILLIAIVIYVYVKWRYFTLRGSIAGIPPQFFYGNLLQIGLGEDDSIAHALEKMKGRFGDVFQFWMGSSHYIVLSGIEDVQYVFTHRQIYDQSDLFTKTLDLLYPDSLICSKGATYKRHAAVIVPLLRRGKMLPHISTIVQCTDKLLDRWRANDRNHLYKNIVLQMEQLTMAIFGHFAFGYDLKTLDGEEGLSNEFTRALHNYIGMSKMVMFYPRFLMIPYMTFNRSFQKALATIRRYSAELIKQERQFLNTELSTVQRNKTSLIASLVSAMDIDQQSSSSNSQENKHGLTSDEVLNEVLSLLAAGYEGSSTALAWLIFCLSKHRRIQEKIKELLKEKNLLHEKDFSIEQLDELVYLDWVIAEVMRWAPNFDFTARTLTVDDRLPTSQVQLYKGQSVLISFYNLSHDPRYWNIGPERFYPERFEQEDKHHHPYASIAFGAGHRMCKGQDFSKLEMKVILLRLMQELTIVDAGDQINAGGHYQTTGNVQPKFFAIYIHFDNH